MDNGIPADFHTFVERVREPENLFSGLRLSNDFCIPDNLLVFYHPYLDRQQPQAHGRCTIVIPLAEMTYYVERNRIDLHPGEALLIPPYAQRFLHPEPRGYQRLFITFDLRSFAPYTHYAGVNALTEASWRNLKEFLELYFAEKANEATLRLLDFMRSWEKTEVPSAKASKKLGVKMEQAVEYIQSNLEHVNGLWSVARHCQLSESRLRSLFKSEFGVSAGKYVAQQRLEAAKYLLQNTKMPVSEVALRTGFSNQFVFSTFFKRHTGLPPQKYRSEKQTAR